MDTLKLEKHSLEETTLNAADLFNAISEFHNAKIDSMHTAGKSLSQCAVSSYIVARVFLAKFEPIAKRLVSSDWGAIETVIRVMGESMHTYTDPATQPKGEA